MVPLVYAVAAVAMGFTAFSYVTMSRAFPVAGSVYSYAARAIGESVGFLAGWAILLDYLLMPALVCVVCAVAIQAVVPGVPRVVWIIFVLGFGTAINVRGIETTARLNAVLLMQQLALLGLFLVLGLAALADGATGAQLSASPLFQPTVFTPSLIFGAVSIAVMSFLGFDGISTLAEEAKGGAQAVGRATLLALLLAGSLMVAQSYLASLFVLDRSSFVPGQATDGAFYTIAEIVGGTWFMIVAAASKVLATGIGVGLTAQAATARLLFGMARDGKLPRLLAHVHPKHEVPDRAVLVCAAIYLVLGVAMVNQLELLSTLISFGALTGFLMLHLSVIVHFMWRQKSKDWLRHLLVPLIGFAIIAYVLVNMAPQAKIAGIIWLCVGAIALVGLKLSGKKAMLPE
jgi:amino acid transporter